MFNKLGIITLNGYYNYGNRLQNYATEQVLKSLGFEVKTILKDKSGLKNRRVSDYISTLKSMENKQILKVTKNRFKYYLNKYEIDAFKTEKTKLFKNFSAKYLNETDYAIDIDNIPKDLHTGYHFFVSGSDQVWNPYTDKRHSSFNFLTFAPKHKRIAYAPSFGVSKISTEKKEDLKKWISGMHKLSVREEEGAKIIKELTGRDAIVLVDPTMMIEKDDWLSISKADSKKPDGDYLLTYIIGKIPRAKERKIRKFAKENGYTIVDLAMGSDWSDYIVGPSEYIDYINSARAVFTDSFHGTIFSILFNTPFVTFKRRGTYAMNSRINTLLTKFNFMDRLEDNINLTKREVMDIDFSYVDAILAKEREKTYEYLKEAFNL